MVIKNLENKIKLVTIVCCVFLAGCVVISMSSIWTARSMVADAQKKIYVLDGTVPVLVERMEKARVFDPFGHAGFDPSGKIRLTP